MNPLSKLSQMEEGGLPRQGGAAALQKSLVSPVLPPPSGHKEGSCQRSFRARVGLGIAESPHCLVHPFRKESGGAAITASLLQLCWA